jgi:serine/threonine-protein kinase RsbW
MDPSERRAGRRDTDQWARFALELKSDLRLIESAVTQLVERCREFGFGGQRLSLNFRVGVAEALANAMIYGNGRDPRKQVRVEVELTPARVAVVVRDEGCGFDPDSVPDPTLPENLERPGGRGIFLIRELMDEVDFTGCGNCVRMVLHNDLALPRAS